MKQDFNRIIEQIKQDTSHAERTKTYILKIKDILDRVMENCKDEVDKKELLKEFLEEYDKELEFRGNAEDIYYRMLQHRAYKEILSLYKGNKNKFNGIIREAKKRELRTNEGNQEKLIISKDLNECMIGLIRNIMRSRPGLNEKDMILAIQQIKSEMEKIIKSEMISIIQNSASYLDEYGIIDEYIESSNKSLETLSLQQLKMKKRNPIPNEEYDEDGNLKESNEDIGVIDSFETEELEKLQPEDLAIMTAFWESKYLEERLEVSKAIATINSLDLWPEILEEDEEMVKNIDNEEIISALKKDLALTYLSRNDIEITSKVRKQYAKFLKENTMDKDKTIEEELASITPEYTNLEAVANDITILQCLIIHGLQAKDIKIKNWGIVETDETEENNEKRGLPIAIEHQNFRGPLLMELPEEVLKNFFNIDTLNLPKYKNSDIIDEEYSSIMSKIYLPSNEYFKRTIKKEYELKPTSTLLAVLTGKKPKKDDGKDR